MGNKYRQPPPDYVRRTLDITDRLDTLENTPRATNTSVDAGHFKFLATNGIVMVDFGFGTGDPGLGPGWIFRRGINGNSAFYLGGNQVSGNQFWRLCDNELNDIITDDAQSGQGLARPYLPYPTIDALSASNTPQATTTSTTFALGGLVRGFKQHPVIDLQYIITTPAGVSAEVQLVDSSPTTDVIIAGPNTHGPSSFTYGRLQGPIDGAHMRELDITLQYRVSSGAGTIGISTTFAYGRQS